MTATVSKPKKSMPQQRQQTLFSFFKTPPAKSAKTSAPAESNGLVTPDSSHGAKDTKSVAITSGAAAGASSAMEQLHATEASYNTRDDTPPSSSPSESSRRRKVAASISYKEEDTDEEDAANLRMSQPKRRKTGKVFEDSDDDDDTFVPEPAAGEESSEDFGDPPDSEDSEDATGKKKSPTAKRPASHVSKAASLAEFAAGTSLAESSVTLRRPSPRSAFDALTGDERRAQKAKKFKEENEERYAWLLDIRDAEKRGPDHPDYDPRTLYIPKSSYADMKPFERQFWDIKRNCWDTVLFFQKGKFYELYEGDATLGHQLFDLKLTDRVNMRMVGVPESSFEHWASQFVAKGYKVARVDQMETALGKEMNDRGTKAPSTDKVVRRELVQMLTNGTLVDERMITSDLGTYCMAIKELCTSEYADPEFAACWVDTSTGEFQICWFNDDFARTKLDTLIAQIQPKELLLEKGVISSHTVRLLKRITGASSLWTYITSQKEFWDEHRTERHYNSTGYFDERKFPEVLEAIMKNSLAMSALGALTYYLQYLKIDRDLISMGNFAIYDMHQCASSLVLNGQTLKNLEVFANSVDGGTQGTLFNLLCRCITSFGKRTFHNWLCHPLYRINDINSRLDAIETINADVSGVEAFEQYFKFVPDLERMISRVHAGRCKPKDFVRVLEGFKRVSTSLDRLANREGWTSGLLGSLLLSKPYLNEILNHWEKAFNWKLAKEENIIVPEKGVELDFDESAGQIKAVETELQNLLKGYQKRLNCRDLTFKSVGKEIYQVEVPKSSKAKIPADWARLSGTSKFDRYWPPDLRLKIRELQELQETHNQISRELEGRFYKRFDQNYDDWRRTVKIVAELDCIVSLARASASLGECCRPEFVDKERSEIQFENLRHPCLELDSVAEFIPNDIKLGGSEASIILLTGPNMAGKSTLLRQTCIAVLMGQMGCYVPATKAVLTPVDSIKSRLGAQDNIFASHSTFMVELNETKKIMEEATSRSLVILDELGRGTSTFDGAAIACAVLHYLASYVGPLGFFSTHYNSLAEEFVGNPEVAMKNMSAMVDDDNRRVTFLYKLVDGVCSSSHGMNVAAMAGVPHDVIDVAEKQAQAFEHMSQSRELTASHDDAGMVGMQSDFVWLVNVTKDEAKLSPHDAFAINRLSRIDFGRLLK